jgi:hypothetical protein
MSIYDTLNHLSWKCIRSTCDPLVFFFVVLFCVFILIGTPRGSWGLLAPKKRKKMGFSQSQDAPTIDLPWKVFVITKNYPDYYYSRP